MNAGIFSLYSSKTDADYAAERKLGRTYFSESFPAKYMSEEQNGHPSRYIRQIVHEEDPSDGISDCATSCDCERYEVYTSEKGRIQIQAHVVRSVGEIHKTKIQYIRVKKNSNNIEREIVLDANSTKRLYDALSVIYATEPDGERSTLDPGALEAILGSGDVIAQIHSKDPEILSAIIESEIDAKDVYAVASRRAAVSEFSKLLSDDEHFDAIKLASGRTTESVWQNFLEENPWILGATLGSQIFFSYDEERLEKVVAGHSIDGPGKRADGVLTTAGAVRSLVFAEIKTHKTELVGSSPYRPGVYPPGNEVMKAVSQAQATVDEATRKLTNPLRATQEGFPTGPAHHTFSPRSYLIIGDTNQFVSAGAVSTERYRTFELLRRSITSPEILTFDELLRNADWLVSALESR